LEPVLDNEEVFYGPVSQDNCFEYEKHKTVAYYRIPWNFFDENATFIDSKQFSEREKEVHRPDLPLRLNCFQGIFWTNNSFWQIEWFWKLSAIKRHFFWRT